MTGVRTYTYGTGKATPLLCTGEYASHCTVRPQDSRSIRVTQQKFMIQVCTGDELLRGGAAAPLRPLSATTGPQLSLGIRSLRLYEERGGGGGAEARQMHRRRLPRRPRSTLIGWQRSSSDQSAVTAPFLFFKMWPVTRFQGENDGDWRLCTCFCSGKEMCHENLS